MSRIRSQNTKPELMVRSLLHNLGYRYRLNGKVSVKHCSNGVLPGKPDIVIPRIKTVIFIHGCFWHRHYGCKFSYKPKSRTEFWEKKFKENQERDNEVYIKLKSMGWKIIIIWECETRDIDKLKEKIFKELNIE